MIKGVLYATVGMRRSVVAIDPGTGETLWIWRIDEGERLQAAPRPNSGRGVAYWEDPDGNGRILVITPGYHLVALDAVTGYQVESFGEPRANVRFDDQAVDDHFDVVPHLTIEVQVLAKRYGLVVDPCSHETLLRLPPLYRIR